MGCNPTVLSVVAQKTHLSLQTISLREEIEYRLEQFQIDTVNGPQVLDSPHGIN